ncbi:MAG TPA: hypothetical protein DCF33_16645 [Saprospirales bacterium]|nr:hypothetical protein [Saprospirales bacterium]
MTRLLISSLLLQVAATLCAQSGSWSFGATVQGGISFPTFQDKTNPDYEEWVNALVLPQFASGGSLNVTWHVAPRIALQSGIGYWQSGHGYKEQDLIIITPDFPEGEYKGTYEGRVRFNDITIPLYIKVSPISGNNKFYLIGGFAGLYRLSRKQIVELNFLDGTTETSKEEMKANYRSFTDVNLRSDLGFGYAFPLGKKMQWFLEPLFGYQLFPSVKEGDGVWGQYFLGLNLGVTMNDGR